MIKVYVAGAYSANNVLDVLKNIGRGEKACAELFRLGYAPFCPWHDKSYVTDNCDIDLDVDQFYEYSIAWLRVSDCMLVLPGYEQSEGTLVEIEIANSINMPVIYNIEIFKLHNVFENWVVKK